MNEFLDTAYHKFVESFDSYSKGISDSVTESDVRLKVIDRIFTEILGWQYSDITTEEETGSGYLDYKFSIEGLGRLVVEAKRDSASFGFTGRNSGRAYKLSGPVLSKSPHPLKGISQAIAYSGVKNCELACVTNGNEWLIFRANRTGDGTDTRDGMGFIFTSLEEIKSNFSIFFDLLAKEKVEKFSFRPFFQEAEGQPIRATPFSKTLRPVDSYRALDKSDLARDIDRVMAEFFRKISGESDPEMLAECFVTTKDSENADRKLIRIASDLSTKIRGIDTTNAESLSTLVKRVKESGRNEFVLIIGTKGAGKSTFVDRFFRHVLDHDIRQHCLVTRLDVGKSAGDPNTIISWLNDKLIAELEKQLFGVDGPSFEDIQGMFFDEYRRWAKGTYKHLYDLDKTKFKIKFGEHIESIRNSDSEKYIYGLIRSVITSRKMVPCIVFDNTDHFSIDFQQIVFQFARSLYEQETCLVIVPITDKTSWHLSQHGAIQSFDNESFYLPTPLPKTVVEKRINFLQSIIANTKKQKGTGYFTERGIGLSLENLEGFVASLQHVFLETGHVSTWLGNLSNKDIRRCLQLSRDLVASPYLRVDTLIKTYISGNAATVSELDSKRAVIKRSYNIYPTGQNQFVQNIYSLTTEIESSPLLGLRVLRMLRDAKHHDSSGVEDYVDVTQVLDYMYAIGLERRATDLCVGSLLRSGLCMAHDPTVVDINQANRIQLSPSGLQHLIWGSWDETYISIMAQVTPIAAEHSYQAMRATSDLDSKQRWLTETIEFLKYLIDEDRRHCAQQTHEAYLGQSKLIKSLATKLDRLKQHAATVSS